MTKGDQIKTFLDDSLEGTKDVPPGLLLRGILELVGVLGQQVHVSTCAEWMRLRRGSACNVDIAIPPREKKQHVRHKRAEGYLPDINGCSCGRRRNSSRGKFRRNPLGAAQVRMSLAPMQDWALDKPRHSQSGIR